ncbi:hypothetical protein PIB30_009990 [Stylosanthes scabra]|uniref:Uncharacterized protein n=1 Tax=Stylosanthes scabra TaxID=79078 RepID=A0ABU6U4P8_9FABA|nr:hypothetical protein [Stylosanthes scabra]
MIQTSFSKRPCKLILRSELQLFLKNWKNTLSMPSKCIGNHFLLFRELILILQHAKRNSLYGQQFNEDIRAIFRNTEKQQPKLKYQIILATCSLTSPYFNIQPSISLQNKITKVGN